MSKKAIEAASTPNVNAANSEVKGGNVMTTAATTSKAASSKKSVPASKPATKKEESKQPAAPTRDALTACANDMNSKMGLEPAINVKLATQAIARDIMKNAADLDHDDFNKSKKEDEQITDTTISTLLALGFKKPEAPKADPAPAKSKAAKNTPQPAKVKSSKQMKEEKAAAKANKAPAAPKYTRTNAFIDAIKKACKAKKGADFETIINTVTELYTAKGHEDAATADNAKKSRLQMLLDSLVAFDVLKLEGKAYHFKM